MIKWKKGKYYIFVTGSGVKVYTGDVGTDTFIYITEFPSFFDMLNYFKNTNIKYRFLQNKWDVEIM